MKRQPRARSRRTGDYGPRDFRRLPRAAARGRAAAGGRFRQQVVREAGMYGGKSIGTLDSVLLLVNNAVGVGLVAIPTMTQKAGWLLSSAALLLFACLTTLASVCLASAVQHIPGNERFQRRVEFSAIVKSCAGGALWALLRPP